MKIIKISFLVGVMGFSTLTFSFSQSPIERLIESVAAYHQIYPFEKVYLHTDKPHYFLNDTIWIKAYGLMDYNQEYPVKTPSVPLYVELIQDNFSRSESRITIKMEDGLGQGDIVLSRDIKSGVYTIRAYTEWMLNFGADAFFEKKIYIGELNETWGFVDKEKELNLNFFPEGGYTVNGISSKIGFKATDGLGKGIDVQGLILNSRQDTVKRFESSHFGLGSLEFTPQAGETYEVVARSSWVPWRKFNWPSTQDEGVVIKIDPLWQEEKAKIEIFHNFRLPPQEFHLLVQSKGKVVLHKEFSNDQNAQEWIIDQNDFLPGVYTFTLMDEQTRLWAERLVYFLPFASGTARFRTEKEIYKPKEQVKMDIEMLDEFGSPMVGNFSVSVTDAYQVMHSAHSLDIYSYMNLVSELNGKIESPGYYFNKENENAEAYLDNLMLTQGWRRFNWENLSKMDAQPQYLPEPGLTLRGRVFRANDKPIDEVHQLTMLIKHYYGGPIVYEGETDSIGNFAFIGMDFQDSVGIFLQAHVERESKKGQKREVKRNDVKIFEKEIPEPGLASIIGLPSAERYIDFEDYLVTVKNARRAMQQYLAGRDIELAEVTVRGRRSQVIPDNRAIQYNNNPELSITVTQELYNYFNIYDLIRGKFPGVQVVGNVFDFTNPPAILMRGGRVSGFNIVGANIFLDGMPVDPLWAMTIPMAEIERVDLLRSVSRSAVYGAEGAGGVVNILTKGGNPNRDWADVDILGNATTVFRGYTPIREFYTPPEVPEINAPFAIDYRSTIYWNPMLQTDPRGKAFIEFRLTEGSPEVRVNVEGVSENGEAIQAAYTFKVED